MRAIAGVPFTTSRCSDPNDPMEAAREPGTAGG
jgi:hypothetical protein